MQVICSSQFVIENRLHSLASNLAMSFKDLGIVLVKVVNKDDWKQVLVFVSKVSLPKSKQIVDILWQVTVTKKIVNILIKLNVSETTCQSLCSFFRDHHQEICQFIYHINNLKLNNNEGLFYFRQHLGQIGFQNKINGIHFISSFTKLLSLIKSKINIYLKIFIEEIETLIFYYKLPGFSLHQYQHELQQFNQVPLKRITQKIALLRQLFERNRINRQQSIPNNSYHQNNRAIVQSLNVLYGYNYFQTMIMESQYNPYEAKPRFQYEFMQQKNLLLNDLEQFQTQKFDPILTSIKIKQKTEEKKIDSGGYSDIFSGIYTFIPLFTCNQSISNSYNYQGLLKTGYHLVKKKGNINQNPTSLENEFKFLYYIRGKVCPFFAKYYCNSTIEPFSDKEVYLQYYPTSLAGCHLKQVQKMKIMEDICMALLFLNTQGIIHRDLKEYNIMIDRHKRGRLIDFGSVSSIPGVSRFKPIDDKIRSTQGYFMSYPQAVKMVPSLQYKMSKQQFYNHATFDHFGLGKIFCNQFYLEHIINESHLMRYNLRYLYQKCIEPNPNDRLTIEEITIFLRQLMIFTELRTQFWNYGFDPTSRVHIFGQLIGEREMSFGQYYQPEQESFFKKRQN